MDNFLDTDEFKCIKKHYYTIDERNNEIKFFVRGISREDNFNTIVERLYEDYYKNNPLYHDYTQTDVKKKLIDGQDDPQKRISFDVFSGGQSEITGYKYVRSNPGIPCRDPAPFVRHIAGNFLYDPDIEGRGLHFFKNPAYLYSYMTYGDMLAKIKINAGNFEKMFLQRGGINDEYHCAGYFVESLHDLRDSETLEFIANNVDKNEIIWVLLDDSIKHLKRIGVSERDIDKFRKSIIC